MLTEQPYINGIPVHITLRLDDETTPTKVSASVDDIHNNTVYFYTDWKPFTDDKTFKQAQNDVVQEAFDWMEANKDSKVD